MVNQYPFKKITKRNKIQSALTPETYDILKEISDLSGVPVSSLDEFQEGMEVYHDKFGLGKIILLEGRGDDTKAEVMFESFGVKKLVLRFAKLKLKK